MPEGEAGGPTERPNGTSASGAPSDGVHLDLEKTSLAIEDGLLMVLGPDGDPVPPGAFAAAATDQQGASLALPDGTRVATGRVAVVLEAQARAPLAEMPEGAGAWIRAMLRASEQPQPAAPEILSAEAARDSNEAAAVSATRGEPPDAHGADEPGPATPGAAVAASCNGEIPEGGAASPEPAERFLEPAGELDLSWQNGSTASRGPDDGTPSVMNVEDADVQDETAPDRPLPTMERQDGAQVPPGTAPPAWTAPPAAPNPPAMAADAKDPAPGAGDRDSRAERRAESRMHPVVIAAAPAVVAESGPAVILISGLPDGAILSAGVDNRDGTWALSPAQLTGLVIEVPAGASDAFMLEATSIGIDRDGGMSPALCEVRVGPDHALQPTARAAGAASAGIALGLGETLRAIAGDEPVRALVIGGLPAGAELSGGIYDPQIACWVVRPDQLEGLRVRCPASYGARLSVRVTAVVLDRDGRSATRSRNVEIDLSAGNGEVPPDEAVSPRGGIGFWRSRSGSPA